MNLVVDAAALIASIKMRGINPGAVCLDTLNRSLVGSESKDEDMSAYIAGGHLTGPDKVLLYKRTCLSECPSTWNFIP
jgi:hypothetical protein